MFHRILSPLNKRSFFLFGPRGSGKTTWIQSQFLKSKSSWMIDLLDPEQEDLYVRSPKSLETQLLAMSKVPEWVVIDEIQKAPRLLDIVHRLIEGKKQKFILTGSSARKLKRGAANLLAGRASMYHLFPLTSREIGDQFNIQDALLWGTLPYVATAKENDVKLQYLRSYALTYMKEEIQAEQIVRRLDAFRDFLLVAAQCNGHIINFRKIARDIGVDTKTVQSFFEILEDTLLGFFLWPHHQSIRKRQRTHPKFFFFDPGVIRALSHELYAPLTSQTFSFGRAFEHWVILEVFRLNQYSQSDYRLSYLRTHNDSEIDLILDRGPKECILIEIKSSPRIDPLEVKKLGNLKKDFPPKTLAYFVSQDPIIQEISGVKCMPLEAFLRELFP